MPAPIKILLQTTIPTLADDWSIARFGQLAALLDAARDDAGAKLFEVTARDRARGVDPVLSTLDQSDFQALWLFAVDTGDGLTPDDCAAITRFRARGRGLMATRDHMDLGCSICTLGGVGAAHFFHTRNLDPEPDRRVNDDVDTPQIAWPNFHSGANGDAQEIEAIGALHPLLADPENPSGRIRYLPAHPHEGAVGAPPNEPSARVIAQGRSQVTGRTFNLAVAFEHSPDGGRAVAQSTFHHFADYNWDPAAGAPSFVSEPPGDGLSRSPEARRQIRRYAVNLALWLVDQPPDRVARHPSG